MQRYLELKSHRPLITALREDGITTKVRQLATGKTIGGIPFTRGPSQTDSHLYSLAEETGKNA